MKQYQPLLDFLLDPNQTLVGILCDTTDLGDGDKVLLSSVQFSFSRS